MFFLVTIILRPLAREYDVLPIKAVILANGGGVINCASKEVPDPAEIKQLGI